MNNALTLVVPAFNEAENIPTILPKMLEFCEQRQWQLILVNDGSSDTTVSVLRNFEERANMLILHHKVNQGYGAALKTGIRRVETDFTVTLDADGQHKLSDLESMWAALHEQDADMVIGKRISDKPQNSYRQAGKWLIRKITGLILPLHIRDLNSGLKMYRTRLIQRYLHLCPDSMAFSDIITLIFLNQGHRVVEVPVQVLDRAGGASKISTLTAFETMLEILNIIMLLKPLRIFLPASIFCIAVGILWGIPFIVLGRGVSVGSMLAIVTGLILFMVGLMAEQLSLIRKEITLLKSPWEDENKGDSISRNAALEIKRAGNRKIFRSATRKRR
jgi:glycosyltransferase involved in cell wall biosynthesis